MVCLELDLTDLVVSLVVPDDGPAYVLVATAGAQVRLLPGVDVLAAVPSLWMLADAADRLSQRLQGPGRA
jgi:hypothetical protein